jgi:hypothetical protein
VRVSVRSSVVRSSVTIRDVPCSMTSVDVRSMTADSATGMPAKVQIVRADVEVVSGAERGGDEQEAAREEHTEEEDQ